MFGDLGEFSAERAIFCDYGNLRGFSNNVIIWSFYTDHSSVFKALNSIPIENYFYHETNPNKFF